MKTLEQIQEIKEAHNYNYSNSEDRANYFEKMNVKALSVINSLQKEIDFYKEQKVPGSLCNLELHTEETQREINKLLIK